MGKIEGFGANRSDKGLEELILLQYRPRHKKNYLILITSTNVCFCFRLSYFISGI